MVRGVIVVLTAGLMMIMFGMLSVATITGAQESTPPAETTEIEIAPGVAFGLVPPSEDPPALYRLRLAVGATLAFADDPAISLVYVESGTLALQLNTPVSDARPDETAADTDAADTPVTVQQGDYFVLPPLVAGEIRNEGRDSASIVIAAITPELFPAPVASTPAPE